MIDHRGRQLCFKKGFSHAGLSLTIKMTEENLFQKGSSVAFCLKMALTQSAQALFGEFGNLGPEAFQLVLVGTELFRTVFTAEISISRL